MIRVRLSVPPPGANGTITRTGRDGKTWACASDTATVSSVHAAHITRTQITLALIDAVPRSLRLNTGSLEFLRPFGHIRFCECRELLGCASQDFESEVLEM